MAVSTLYCCKRKKGYIMQWYHSKCAHGGRGLTLNELWNCGYWVICGNAAVRKIIFHCVQCCRLCGRLVEQKMADLPYCRVAFTFYGVDIFGPFIIKQRRSQVKPYGAMFTCMSGQAVHIEITHSLDSFLWHSSLHSYLHWGAWLLEVGVYKQSLIMAAISLPSQKISEILPLHSDIIVVLSNK